MWFKNWEPRANIVRCSRRWPRRWPPRAAHDAACRSLASRPSTSSDNAVHQQVLAEPGSRPARPAIFTSCSESSHGVCPLPAAPLLTRPSSCQFIGARCRLPTSWLTKQLPSLTNDGSPIADYLLPSCPRRNDAQLRSEAANCHSGLPRRLSSSASQTAVATLRSKFRGRYEFLNSKIVLIWQGGSQPRRPERRPQRPSLYRPQDWAPQPYPCR